MSTTATQEQALAEFRDASAAARLAFAAHSEAREAQILANRRASQTSDALLTAQDRLERADQDLQEAQSTAPTPAAIDAAKGLTGAPFTGQGDFPTAPAVPLNGAVGSTYVADPAETGIG